MNILKEIKFKPDGPAVLMIKKNEKIIYRAIGLLKGSILPKHKTVYPATLVVVKGSVDFLIDSKTITLKQYDLFEIPVDKEHSVKGLEDENVFTLLQQK